MPPRGAGLLSPPSRSAFCCVRAGLYSNSRPFIHDDFDFGCNVVFGVDDASQFQLDIGSNEAWN